MPTKEQLAARAARNRLQWQISRRIAKNFAEYLDERRKMLQFWADYLDQLRASRADKVVPIKRASGG